MAASNWIIYGEFKGRIIREKWSLDLEKVLVNEKPWSVTAVDSSNLT